MKNFIYTLFLCLVFVNCKKNDDGPVPVEEAEQQEQQEQEIPTNLNANLTVESERVASEEGKPIIINLNLDKAFSEDLVLEGIFSTDNISNYANPEDFKQELEYSSDLGLTWKKENNQTQVKFEKGQVNLKIKIETVNDDLKELNLEESKLVFSSKTPSLMIGDEEVEVQIGIIDDDNIDISLGADVLMTFTFDEGNNYSIQSVTSALNPSIASVGKTILDGGYIEIMEDIKYANTLLPADSRIRTFELLMADSGLGGYVFNSLEETDRNANINNFTMGMNTFFAFINDKGAPFSTDYNQAGQYGIILAHELGHILTLARMTQMDASIAKADCPRLFDDEGCAQVDSYLNKFDTTFYTNPDAFPFPTHVSDYARTNIYEDIAEVIAIYVTQDDIPELSANSSGALQKVHQILGEGALQSFKAGFRSRIKTAFDGFNNSPVSKSLKRRPVFNKFEGEFIPCSQLHHAK